MSPVMHDYITMATTGLFCLYVCVKKVFTWKSMYLLPTFLQGRYNEVDIPHEEEIATYYKLRQQLGKESAAIHRDAALSMTRQNSGCGTIAIKCAFYLLYMDTG